MAPSAEELDRPSSRSDDEKTVRDVQLDNTFSGKKIEDGIVTDGEVCLRAEDDFPDGGLRAWLVVLGVSAVVVGLRPTACSSRLPGCVRKCLDFRIC